MILLSEKMSYWWHFKKLLKRVMGRRSIGIFISILIGEEIILTGRLKLPMKIHFRLKSLKEVKLHMSFITNITIKFKIHLFPL